MHIVSEHDASASAAGTHSAPSTHADDDDGTRVRGDDGPLGRLEPFICLLYYTEHQLFLYTFTAVPGGACDYTIKSHIQVIYCR